MRTTISVIVSVFAATSPLKAEVVSPGSGCPTCAAGEMAVKNITTLDHGKYTYNNSPTCQSGANDDLVKVLTAAKDAVFKNYAGAVKDLVDTKIFKDAEEPVHGEVGKILNAGNSATATCQMMCNIVPVGSEITGYSLAAGSSEDKLTPCDVDTKQDCPVGWSKFDGPPKDTAADNAVTSCVTFMNWSDRENRTARFVTFFKPPAKWLKNRPF